MSAPRTAAELIGRRVSLDVPATTANLGAGFDTRPYRLPALAEARRLFREDRAR